MGMQVICCSKSQDVVKTKELQDIGPETKWSTHDQFELYCNR